MGHKKKKEKNKRERKRNKEGEPLRKTKDIAMNKKSMQMMRHLVEGKAEKESSGH